LKNSTGSEEYEAENSERTQAERDSRSCRFCGGAGMTTVFHREYTGNPVLEFQDSEGRIIRASGRASAHCICTLGRWMREKVSGKIVDRIPDLAQILDQRGESYWLHQDPTPIDPDAPKFVPRRLREQLAAALKAPGRDETP
jgi:hypothetical protein